ncbi:helix-turn-helix domain-containing protein [Chromobacterium amazonense]|uniref:helix-turn-helix domain-containing protein n=1 Tax=Chromobacterium amazonense TaxID=1382803 RepID=UPI000D039803|nr:helix-turn-helix domain-containing protein [Chromobacterium amazonense]
MKYRHLTEGERYQIQALHAEGLGPTAIGQRIGRCKSVISRELRWHQHRSCYHAGEAQRSYRQRLLAKGKLRQPWGPAFDEIAVPLLKG